MLPVLVAALSLLLPIAPIRRASATRASLAAVRMDADHWGSDDEVRAHHTTTSARTAGVHSR